MIADKGVTDVFERYAGRAVNFLAVLLCLSVMIIPIKLVLNESISKYNDTGIFVDSAEVVKTLATTMKPGDAVLTTDPEYSTLFFTYGISMSTIINMGSMRK